MQTIQSGPPSSVSTTDQPLASGADEWLADLDEPAVSTGAATGSPRIVLESADGHRLVLTYEDLVLAAMLLGLTVQVAGWSR